MKKEGVVTSEATGMVWSSDIDDNVTDDFTGKPEAIVKARHAIFGESARERGRRPPQKPR
ncbi:hypothetical protein IEQ34_021384 [Dendrobium chrysotoxum]|uniref:Uncharacterized protein n=1 Tax=Dendrobium chrysotoxum TaxID=161865 RepID=A0AAV7G5E3_DENCH|nr:hypothetical protein IEQ34_021384 [Dendrobium chrysotoxum]